ncbi:MULTISPECIES: BtrH N-terminal domain-containing protein [unclassified Streptomyces]|uniref:BtrH N-terminal domain-containing protein n=1 Tax=unclassified Streptomyces TaxID=2593676 RepID=UPI00381D2BB9
MRVELPNIAHWRHDLGHCLHTTMGVLLQHHGLDPLQVLGANWGFFHRPGDVRREEYYFPLHRDGLLESLAPHHPVWSRWHWPKDAESGWREVREAVLAGNAVAAAADNFHLPFRPAYRDVHTNHLLTVYGFDDERELVLISDPVPPRFQGAIPLGQFTDARDSANPVLHDRDLFFTDNPVANRWLEVGVSGEVPPHDRDFVRGVLAANDAGFVAVHPGPELSGLAGQRVFLDGLADRLGDGDASVIDEAFIATGAVLAMTGVHGDYLAATARQFDSPQLMEASRTVDRVAHSWSALRIDVAMARDEPASAETSVRNRSKLLLAEQELALERLRAAARAL